ncbi:hypothetical protein AAG906_029259 [Vitis piasezkii]
MSPEIMKRYLRLPTAREIWIALAKAFYDGADESRLFVLNQRAFSTKQVGRPLSTYYGDLIEIFQELNHQSTIVGPPNHDHNQLVGKPERLCTHCGETGHTKSRCYDIIGYPGWWDFSKALRKRNSKSNHHAFVSVVESNHVSTSNPKKASSFIATSRNVGKALHISTSVSHSEWIIDSGATHHMTFDNNHIQSMKSSNQHIVSTANDTPSPMIGEGSIALTKKFEFGFSSGCSFS